jgi:outer membrane phospholipase A
MPRLLRCGALLLLCLMRPTWAERLLVLDESTVEAGRIGYATVVDTLPEARLPDILLAVARIEDTLVPIDLAADGVQNGQTRRYHFVWPKTLTGFAHVALKDVARNEVLVQVSTPGLADVAVPPVAAVSEETVVQSDAPALTTNEPMYFLVSPDTDLSARFQLSFKYRLFERDRGFASLLPFLGGLHFGYTQTSIWDLGEPSAPFRDTSYRPSLFYDWPMVLDKDSRHAVVWRGGLEHESNGRDGDLSRSINIAFLQMDWRYRLSDLNTIGIKPKVWGYIEKSDNPDIQDYRGFGQLETSFWHKDWKASVLIRRGKAGKGSTQADLSYPLKGLFPRAGGGFFHMQYFDGEGDTLLEYNQSRDPQFRIGFSIVR